MSARGQAFVTGALVGGVTFVAWFLLFAKGKSADFARIGQDAAPAIAEQAVKDYIAHNYGVTPERIRAAMSRVQQITSIVSLLQAPRPTTTR